MAATDKEIIECIRNGENQKALNFIYKRNLPKIKALIKKMNGSEEDTLDIFQEAIIILYREIKLNRMRPETNIDGFIYTVSRNLYLNKLRTINRIETLNESFINDHSEDPAVEYHLEMRDSESEMIKILDLLGEKCKEILMALAFEGMDYEEVADKFNFSSGDVVKTMKHRCKKKFESLMENNSALYKRLARNIK